MENPDRNGIGAPEGELGDEAFGRSRWEADGDLRPDPAREPPARGEGLFRGAFDRVGVGMAIMDLEGRFLDSNPALQEILGFGREELRRMDIAGLVHQDDRPAVRAAFGGLRRDASAHTALELRYIRMGMSLRWGRLSASRMDLQGAAPPLVVAAFEDITERRLSDDFLGMCLVRYRELVENAAAGVATADSEGRLTFVNDALCRLTGYAEDELVGRHFSDFVPPGDLDGIFRWPGADSGSGRGGPPMEFRLVRKDGRIVHCYTSPTVFQDGGGETTISAIVQDITPRRILEDAVRESEARYRSLVENSSEGILLVASGGRILQANPAACRMLGRSEEELRRIGREGIAGSAGGGTWRALDAGPLTRNFRGELAFLRADGSRFPAQVSTSGFDLPDGEKRTVVMMADNTERKRTEEELVRLSTAVKLVRESVLITDASGVVLFANAAASALLSGCGGVEAGRDFAACLPAPAREKWRLVLAETLRRGSVRVAELELGIAEGRSAFVELGATAMADGGGRPGGLVVIFRDITERRLAQREMRCRLMAFRLDEGEVYLVKESSPVLSMEAFSDLVRAGYRGTVLSRTPPGRPAREADRGFDRLWLSERESTDSIPPRLQRILQWVGSLPRNHAILIDRMDYIVSRCGLRSALELVHRLREAAYLGGHIVILGLDPATLDARWLRAFEKEASEMAPRAAASLPAEQLEIIKYVYQQSIGGRRPTLTDAGRALGISKPTVRRHVRDVVRMGYVALIHRGRTKVLEPTEKGRDAFSK
jgi:PAS domain S-box-containing protein